MARILYPVKTEPVLTDAQRLEQVTESRWHQPFSEPVRRRALATAIVVASGFFAPVYTPVSVEDVTVDKWLAPLSQPSLRKSAISALPSSFFVGSDTATDARWFVPLSEPVRRTGLPVHQHPASFLVQAAPFAESVSIDKWQQPLSEPKRFARNLDVYEQPYLSFVKADPFPETVSADRWAQPLSQPLPRRSLTAAYYPASFFAGYAETITVDKWLAPFSQPVLRKSAISVYPSSFFVGSDTARDARWFTPLSEPVRRTGLPAHQHPASFLVQSAPFAETVSIDKWQQPFSEPKRFARNLAVYHQPYLSFVKADPFPETVSADRWCQPLSVPTRRIRQAEYPAFSYSYFVNPNPDITVEKWHAPLSLPTRLRMLPTAEQPYLSFIKAAPFAEAVSLDRWAQPTAQPVLRVQRTQPDGLSYSYYVQSVVTVDQWFVQLSEPVLSPDSKNNFPSLSYSFVVAASFGSRSYGYIIG